MSDSSLLFSPAQTAEFLGLSTSTLAKMRLRGDGPAYIKLGPRRVAYQIGDISSWVEERRFCSTSQY